MKTFYRLLLALSLLALIGGTLACSASPSASPTPSTASPDVSAIRAYADPATQTTLQGLSEKDLAKYTRYADAQFKAAITQDVLNKTADQINSQLGTFQSIEFLKTEEDSGYTVVHYRATYTKGQVGVRMVFDKDHLVAGQWFE
jgi:hypothetical protein